MISLDEAVSIVENTPLKRIEKTVSLENALGRILAQNIVADRDFPPFDRVTMDGIALKYNSDHAVGQEFRVASTQFAGDPQQVLDSDQEVIEIMTGASCPQGADSVVRYEDLVFKDEGTQSKRVKVMELPKKAGQNIHKKGSDRKKGEVLLSAGTLMGPPEIAVAATVGMNELRVIVAPRIAIISTGNELVAVEETPLPHQIRHSNVHAIQTALREIHFDSDRFHLPDNAQKTKEKLAEVLELYDIIIMTGGVSKGKADYVPDALDSLGVKKLFHRVAQRPGKPFWFGQSQNGEVIFALPGNPVSTFMCFTRYLKPWLLQQTTGREVIPIPATLTQDVTFTPALTYLLQVQLSRKPDGTWDAMPVEGHGSGDLANLTHCNAFLELPPQKIEFKKGSIFPAWAYRMLMCILFLFSGYLFSQDQRIDFQEYTLGNGLHVILHQDRSVPMVAIHVNNPFVIPAYQLKGGLASEAVRFLNIHKEVPLVLAGNFHSDSARKWIQFHFGSKPRDTTSQPSFPTLHSHSQVEVRDTIWGDYPLPFLTFTYHAPNITSPDYFVMEMLDLLLAKGKTSRLDKALIEEKELALTTKVKLYPGKDSVLALISTMAAPKIDLQDLEIALEKEITRIKTEKVAEWELEKLQNQMETKWIKHASSMSDIATQLAYFHFYHNNTRLINSVLAKYQSVSREDLQRVAGTYLAKTNRTLTYHLPHPTQKKG